MQTSVGGSAIQIPALAWSDRGGLPEIPLILKHAVLVLPQRGLSVRRYVT
ncbi:hypothetical protein PF005_g2619 [Phytophthora fragariae]|uniref:Uncharacterized protein n=2 Tax=Phytophthora TaxID=4783 RepID=A0A6A3V3B6_9STRA|nr:hypothetical protein PF003_g17366 [Phytophthora fragariae]KAE9038027.1 hypothetical protein PR002_g6227 [Phytophthora rubi]KAE8947573.1 hypothetical protein PF009_g2836 [Phytophthora fragariae]KAE9024279.1 hypothetical protein PF011_g3577 [Phytophthora fragariae]KAE9124439.1 hypothetical protein PF007_g6721 [Phytophthora fragariae]